MCTALCFYFYFSFCSPFGSNSIGWELNGIRDTGFAVNRSERWQRSTRCMQHVAGPTTAVGSTVNYVSFFFISRSLFYFLPCLDPAGPATWWEQGQHRAGSWSMTPRGGRAPLESASWGSALRRVQQGVVAGEGPSTKEKFVSKF